MDRLKPQGDYISKEQFCKQAHISKRKAVELMQNGTVPAIDTHRKTRRYWIAQEDVDRYILSKTKRQFAAERSRPNKVRCEGALSEYNRRDAANLRKSISFAWMKQPDLLSIRRISELLGYNRQTISVWIAKWELPVIQTQKGRMYPKKAVIQAITSREFHEKKYKSWEHVKLLEEHICVGTGLSV